MLGCMNEHFVTSGSLFESLTNARQESTSVFSGDTSMSHCFTFNPVTASEVHKAFKLVNIRKPTGPDNLKLYFLNPSEDFIAQPLTHFLNLLVLKNEMSSVWKSVFV